ncbi:hypothetical protein WK65_17260 [Burkholderia ubonensis]|nr:hypothetical protein WK65_17260 [Burkholderia ubonensis]
MAFKRIFVKVNVALKIRISRQKFTLVNFIIYYAAFFIINHKNQGGYILIVCNASLFQEFFPIFATGNIHSRIKI